MDKITFQNGSSIEILKSNSSVRSSRAYNDCSNCGNYEFCTDDDKEYGMYFFNYSCWEEYEDE